MPIEINYPFTTPANYTFDENKIEVSGGKAKLKDIRPTGFQIFDNYSYSTANWGQGTLTRTLVGATISEDKQLDCFGGTVKYCDYNADNFTTLGGEGKIDVKIRPDFNGSPGETTYLYAFSSGTANQILVYLLPAGSIIVRIYDQNAQLRINRTVSKNDWISGQQYRLILFFKSGDTRLYLGGVLQFQDNTTFTRVATGGTYRFGSWQDSNGHFKYDDLYIGNVADFITNSIYSYYSLDNPTIEINTAVNMEDLLGFVETSTKSGNDEIKYILKKDSIYYWHNGANWTVSNGTYSQANTVSEIDANKSTFSSHYVFKFKAFLHSYDGQTKPELDNILVTYDFYGLPHPDPPVCVVWGYILDPSGQPIPNIYISAKLVQDAIYDSALLPITEVTYISDADGYWELELIPTVIMEKVSYELEDILYEFTFVFSDYTQRDYKSVPNESYKKYSELTA